MLSAESMHLLEKNEKNRAAGISTINNEIYYGFPSTENFLTRISTGNREMKSTVEVHKNTEKADLHSQLLSLDVANTVLKSVNSNNDSFSNRIISLSPNVIYANTIPRRKSYSGSILDVGIKSEINENTNTPKSFNRSDNQFNLNSSNTIGFDNQNYTQQNSNYDNYENDTKTVKPDIHKIACTEIERLRISQLYREHEMKEKLNKEQEVMINRRIQKQLLARSAMTVVNFQAKKRRNPVGSNNKTPVPKKSTKLIPKYAPTPAYSNKDYFSKKLDSAKSSCSANIHNQKNGNDALSVNFDDSVFIPFVDGDVDSVVNSTGSNSSGINMLDDVSCDR